MALLWRQLLFPLFILLSTFRASITGVSGSVSEQLMNTLMTVASANGILPDIVSVLDAAAAVDVNILISQLLNCPQCAQNQVSASGIPNVQQACSSCLNTNCKPNYAACLQQINQCECSALPNTIYSSQNELQCLVRNQLNQLNSLSPQIPACTQKSVQVYQNTPETSRSLPITPALLQDANLYSPNIQLNEPTTLTCVDLVALNPTSCLKTVSVSQCDKPLGVRVSISPSKGEVPLSQCCSMSEAPQSNSDPPIIVAPGPVGPPRSSNDALLPLLLLSLLDNNNGIENCGGRSGCCNCGYGNNCGCSCGSNSCCGGNNCGCSGCCCNSNCGGNNCGCSGCCSNSNCGGNHCGCSGCGCKSNCGGNNCGCSSCCCNSNCGGNNCGCSGSDACCLETLYDDPLYPVYVPEDTTDPFVDGPLYDEEGCYYYYRCK